MYIPKQYQETNLQEIEALVREFGFATLVSVNDGTPMATHIPLQLEVKEDGNWLLHGHLAKANPQWRSFENNNEVLAVFMGPHTYVSPSWYTQPNVPTWNYRAAHLRGKVRLIEGEELEKRLSALMQHYEKAHAEHPLKYEGIPDSVIKPDLRALVGIEIAVYQIHSASKLSQNRDKQSYDNIINELKNMNAYDAKRIAEEMEKRKEP